LIQEMALAFALTGPEVLAGTTYGPLLRRSGTGGGGGCGGGGDGAGGSGCGGCSGS
jgi:hypothetical protein